MSIYYLCSGFAKDCGFSAEIVAQLHKDIKNKKSLVYIASLPSPERYEKTAFYMAINTSWFEKIGSTFEQTSVIDHRKSPDEAVNLIKNASVIFLMGRTTLAQMAFILEYGLTEPLKYHNGVIIGLSAGAINMAKVSLCSKDAD